MAEIAPFCGVRYNESLTGDLSAVICPPYDVISPQMEPELYRHSEYNFIRIEHGRPLLQDTASDNRYTRSAATLERWLKEGILIVDKVPAIYLHDHYFAYQGKKHRCRGLVVRVRLEEWDRMVVRPHEGTLAGPKSDRISLLGALKANTSPIMALFEDKEKQVSSLLSGQASSPPLISLAASNGEGHQVWAITEPEMIARICRSFSDKPLYIADGHHRYESALVYRRQRRALSLPIATDEPLNFVMMTLVDFADPGLVILPPHRLIRGLSSSRLNSLMDKLNLFFDIKEMPLSTPKIWQRIDELVTEADRIRLVLFGLEAGQLLVLTLRDLTAAGQMMPYFHSEVYKRLDVSIVDHVILEELLGLSSGEEARITYNYDRQETVNRVLAGEYQLAFILKPVTAGVIKAIADAGDRMPRKSTYFYPKVPSGLVFYRLV